MLTVLRVSFIYAAPGNVTVAFAYVTAGNIPAYTRYPPQGRTATTPAKIARTNHAS